LETNEEWISAIADEVYDLKISFCIFEKINDLVKTNKHVQKQGGHYISWQNQNYDYRVATQISRLLDDTTNTEDRSLINFLKTIRDKKAISFNSYSKLFVDTPISKEEIEGFFKSLTGLDSVDYCLCEMINRDISNLKSIKIKPFRNKKIAHLTSAKIKEKDIPTYQNINDYINLLIDITSKYYLLLTAIQKEWEPYGLDVETVFTKPWIEPK